MNKRILGIAVTILAIAVLASPVAAIGPLKPLEKGNPNFSGSATLGIVRMDSAGNTFFFMTDLQDVPEENNEIFRDAMAEMGGGRMNNAIILDIQGLMSMKGNEEPYFNKWVYMSGDKTAEHPNDNQFAFPQSGIPGMPPDLLAYLHSLGSHGMFYWFAEFAFGFGYGAVVAEAHPDGVFAMWHHVAGDSK
jgi:hypothetical protein